MYAPELGPPHRVREIWMALSPQPNAWVDITEFIYRKIEAIACHASQVPEPAIARRRA